MTICPECGTPVVAVTCTVDPQHPGEHVHRGQCGHRLHAAQARWLWTHGGLRWDVPAVTGASLGAAERDRQVHDEGYTPAADAARAPGDLAWRAFAYLDRATTPDIGDHTPPRMWPGAAEEWKGDASPLRMLVIAQALIAAELDRLLTQDRGAQMPDTPSTPDQDDATQSGDTPAPRRHFDTHGAREDKAWPPADLEGKTPAPDGRK